LNSFREVSIAKKILLQNLMKKYNILEQDLEEKFVLGSGSGGQKINKTSSCVWLSHKISGYQVKCQRTRSRVKNRYYARLMLCYIFAKAEDLKKQHAQKQENLVKQKSKVPSRKQQLFKKQAKVHRATIKANRKVIKPEN
jgi:peptide chain release factor